MIRRTQQGLIAEGVVVSVAKLCAWFGIPRRTVYYKPVKAAPKVEARFSEPIKKLIEEEPSFGYRTVAWLLGFNKNTVQRIFQIKGWQVRKRAVGMRPRIQVEGEGEWHARKHGGPKRRVWRKIHLGVDEETLEIRAVEITGSHIGDAPVLPDLLSQISEGQEIGSVTADGAYDTRKCHDAIADRGAHAVIPPRKNAKPWKTVTAGAVARNEALRASKYLGRAIWRRWRGYHRRSRVETKMHCVKRMGQRLMARNFDSQVAELQVRIAVLNGYTALGIPITEAAG
ncbi:IS5 family transposase [Rhodovulum sulfidophilum]|uniref:IS5 family transposase n=2 Tax=Rhodovulum sulfidophilum TaxID=35806 RepID=UPI000A5AEDEE